MTESIIVSSSSSSCGQQHVNNNNNNHHHPHNIIISTSSTTTTTNNHHHHHHNHNGNSNDSNSNNNNNDMNDNSNNHQTKSTVQVATCLLVPSSNQVAGHQKSKDGKKGLLVAEAPDPLDGVRRVYKPIQTGPRGDREVLFYETMLPRLQLLRQFVPRYYGTTQIVDEDGQSTYMILEDLTQHYQRPCIIDLKMGQQTYSNEASQEKIEYELSKFPDQHLLGFRISGMQVYDAAKQTFKRMDAKWGRLMDRHRIMEGLAAFFNISLPSSSSSTTTATATAIATASSSGTTTTTNNNTHHHQHQRYDVIEPILSQLRLLLEYFETHQTMYKFVASSILIIYEGDQQQQQQDNNNNNNNNSNNNSNSTSSSTISTSISRVTVKMIDFAHVFPLHEEQQQKQQQQQQQQDGAVAAAAAAHTTTTTTSSTNSNSNSNSNNNNSNMMMARDHGYIYGLAKLIHYLEQILATATTTTTTTITTTTTTTTTAT